MKSKPKPTPEHTAFRALLGRSLQVTHEEIQARIKAQQQRKKRKAKPSASGRVSCDRD